MLSDPHPGLGAAEDLGNKGSVESGDDSEKHHFGLLLRKCRGHQSDSLLRGHPVDGLDLHDALGRERGKVLVRCGVGVPPRRPAKILDDSAACDRERPCPESGLVPLEGANASGDGLPHLAGDVVRRIGAAAQIAEQAGLQVFEEQPNRPPLAASCRIDDRGRSRASLPPGEDRRLRPST